MSLISRQTLDHDLDAFAHFLGDGGIVFQVADRLCETLVDPVLVVEKIRGEFLEALKIFFEYFLSRLGVGARRGRFHFFETEFRFFLRLVHQVDCNAFPSIAIIMKKSRWPAAVKQRSYLSSKLNTLRAGGNNRPARFQDIFHRILIQSEEPEFRCRMLIPRAAP